MKKLSAILILVLTFTLSACVPAEETEINEEITEQPPTEVVPVDSSMTYEDYLICENNEFPFELDELGGGHGQVTFTGYVTEIMEQRPWSMDENDLIPAIYFWVQDEDIKEASTYYEDMIDQGNTINRYEGGQLGFRIGINENQEFSSTAEISDTTLNAILDAVETGEYISLMITQAFLPGMGAPENYSFACKIELVK